MKTRILSLLRARILFHLFLLTLAGQVTSRAGVLPPDGVVEDKTIGEWSAEWWKWVFSLPTNQNPLFDMTGTNAHNGEPDGPVFFLAGTFGGTGQNTVTRRLTVSEEKYLFYPILNVYAGDPADPPTIEGRRNAAAAFITSFSELHASIDGAVVPNLPDHRALSPVFSFEFPSCDNLMTVNNGFCISGLVDNLVADGYYLMLEPLPPGEHVINFGGSYRPPFDFTLDITDHIKVVQIPLEQRVEELMMKVEAAGLPPHRLRSLQASLEAARASFAKGKLKSGVHHLRTFQHKVREKVAKMDGATAAELIEAAQAIIDRTRAFPPRAGVLPPDAVLGDRTIGEWTAEWWKWVFSAPTNQNPHLDPDGRWANVGQPDASVFFLGGSAGLSLDTIFRTLIVPEDKFLLVPLLVAQADNIDTDPPLSIEELRNLLRDFVNDPQELHATINGLGVPNLMQHRAESPIFSFEFADPDNFKTYTQGHPILGLVDPILSDGYWLMVEPLAVGSHVLHYGGTWRLPFFFRNDIVVNITVVPVPLEQRVEELMAKVEAAGLPSHRLRSLQASLEAARSAFAEGKLKSGAHHLRTFQHKVRAKVAKLDDATAAELDAAAQEIIDRAIQQQKNQP